MNNQSFSWKQVTAIVAATLLISKGAELAIPSLASFLSGKTSSSDEHDEEMEDVVDNDENKDENEAVAASEPKVEEKKAEADSIPDEENDDDDDFEFEDV